MTPVIFIHCNDQQLLPAKVAAYALRARSQHPDAFEVRLLRLEETPHLLRREGQRYLHDDKPVTWSRRNLQSFAPLRKMVPQIMGYQGTALVLDPDVFALGDVHELLSRDMQGKAILCRMRNGWRRGAVTRMHSSAVMLLDCARLKHWQWNAEIDALFAMQMDFWDWFYLRAERPDSIGLFEDEWNDLDSLTERTKLLHTTEILTQPWRTGLLIARDASPDVSWPRQLVRAIRRRINSGRGSAPRVHQPHPDARQERLFFALLRECLERGEVTRAFLTDEIRKRHLRADAFKLLDSGGTSGAF